VRKGVGALVLGLVSVALLTWACPAQAEDRDLFERISPDFEFFAVRNVDGPGQDSFSFGGGGAVHIELNIVKSIGLHLGGQLLVLGPGDVESSVFFFGSQAGARFHWSAWVDALPGDAWIEVHHVFGRSGGISRHGMDGGLGYGFELAPTVTLGPFARATWMSDPGLSDPFLLSFGASLSLMARTRLGEDIPDEDNDGVPDWDDMCPDQATGRHADPENEGCPARDRDGDGLVDPLDECPSESMWPYPSREEDGCPMADRDADGVPDAHDLCPDTFAPDGGDPLREGCIEGDEPF